MDRAPRSAAAPYRSAPKCRSPSSRARTIPAAPLYNVGSSTSSSGAPVHARPFPLLRAVTSSQSSESLARPEASGPLSFIPPSVPRRDTLSHHTPSSAKQRACRARRTLNSLRMWPSSGWVAEPGPRASRSGSERPGPPGPQRLPDGFLFGDGHPAGRVGNGLLGEVWCPADKASGDGPHQAQHHEDSRDEGDLMHLLEHAVDEHKQVEQSADQ